MIEPCLSKPAVLHTTAVGLHTRAPRRAPIIAFAATAEIGTAVRPLQTDDGFGR